MEVAFCLVAWSLAPRLIQALSSSRIESSANNKAMRVFGVDRNIDIPLVPTEDELTDIVPGCDHLWYESCVEGAKLHYRKVVPKSPKAILVYVHGIQTHGGKAFVLSNGRKINFALLADVCMKEDIALYAPDMYGHGYSEGKRWMIPDTWENNLKDLDTFVKLIENDYGSTAPLFLLGESYGGTLTIHLARQYQDKPEDSPKNFAGLMLTGPAIIGDVPAYPVYFVLRYMLAPLFPAWIPFFMPNPVSADRIWRDPDVLAVRTTARMKELMIDSAGTPFRLGTATNLLAALEAVRSQAIPGFTVPFCIAHGTQDMGVPIKGSEFMVKNASTPKEDAEFHQVADAYHDLLADPTAEQVVGYFMDFMKKQMQKKR
jgi:acylglycerol lipase